MALLWQGVSTLPHQVVVITAAGNWYRQYRLDNIVAIRVGGPPGASAAGAMPPATPTACRYGADCRFWEHCCRYTHPAAGGAGASGGGSGGSGGGRKRKR